MNQQIRNVSDMMRAIQADIEAVRAGTLSESSAKVIFTGVKLQLGFQALNLQHQRIHKGTAPLEMPLLLASAPEVPATNGKKVKAKV